MDQAYKICLEMLQQESGPLHMILLVKIIQIHL